jgi:hypothetical protein
VRLSDLEREQFYELLSRHAAAGRLGVEELERRVERVAHATSRDEATAVLSDLPPLTGTAPGPRPRRGRRGHGDAEQPGVDWTPTSERFRDPRSGQVMRVWIDAAGGRHYLPDA